MQANLYSIDITMDQAEAIIPPTARLDIAVNQDEASIPHRLGSSGTLQVSQIPDLDSKLRKRTVRKLDFNVMPLVTAICMFSNRDKTSF